MDATNELDRQDQGVTTFWDAVTHEDTRDSIKQLGYTLKGPNGENKYSVYMMEKKIGTMTHEPEKAKWFITKSLTSCWFITFLNELVMDKNLQQKRGHGGTGIYVDRIPKANAV
jgi:hypothetical protein